MIIKGMKEIFHIKTSLLKENETVLYTFLLIAFGFVGISGSIWIARFIDNNYSIAIIIIGFLLFLVIPVIYISKKPALLTKKAIIQILDESIVIDILDKKTDQIREHHEIEFKNLNSFKIGETDYNNTSFLKLIKKDGTSIQFSFFEQNDKEENVFKNVFTFFKEYNVGKPENEKITLLPNLYNTKSGKLIIYSLAILIVVAVALLILMKPEAIPFGLLVGIIFFARIKAQQKKDSELLERFE